MFCLNEYNKIKTFCIVLQIGYYCYHPSPLSNNWSYSLGSMKEYYKILC